MNNQLSAMLGTCFRDHELTCPVSGPAGLDIGGQLPQSIALSILAECHGMLYRQCEPLARLAAAQ